MRHGVGEEYSQGISVQLTRVRADARRLLNEKELVRALRTVRNEVQPLADKLRQSAPETFEADRDALAVLLNDCAPALVDEGTAAARGLVRSAARPENRVRDIDSLLDAGRPGERPMIQQLFRGAVEYARDPVLREVIRANQQGVHILQRAGRRIQMLVDAI